LAYKPQGKVLSSVLAGGSKFFKKAVNQPRSPIGGVAVKLGHKGDGYKHKYVEQQYQKHQNFEFILSGSNIVKHRFIN
jgi:hypothetical protein